jgi:hypothetical protein
MRMRMRMRMRCANALRDATLWRSCRDERTYNGSSPLRIVRTRPADPRNTVCGWHSLLRHLLGAVEKLLRSCCSSGYESCLPARRSGSPFAREPIMKSTTLMTVVPVSSILERTVRYGRGGFAKRRAGRARPAVRRASGGIPRGRWRPGVAWWSRAEPHPKAVDVVTCPAATTTSLPIGSPLRAQAVSGHVIWYWIPDM